MGTFSVSSFCIIAVVAKHFVSIWSVFFDGDLIHISCSIFFSLLVSVSQNMLKGKELLNFFSATFTFSSVHIEEFLSSFSVLVCGDLFSFLWISFVPFSDGISIFFWIFCSSHSCIFTSTFFASSSICSSRVELCKFFFCMTFWTYSFHVSIVSQLLFLQTKIVS